MKIATLEKANKLIERISAIESSNAFYSSTSESCKRLDDPNIPNERQYQIKLIESDADELQKVINKWLDKKKKAIQSEFDALK